MEADLTGPQRKIITAEIKPRRRAHGAAGIPLRAGQTLPFVVTRAWSAPAGHYTEQWFVVHPDTREVLFESPQRETLIWGLQSPTELSDEVQSPFALTPGHYLVVFALGGVWGGQVETDATEIPAEEAA
jgi:hypothetical protein